MWLCWETYGCDLVWRRRCHKVVKWSRQVFQLIWPLQFLRGIMEKHWGCVENWNLHSFITSEANWIQTFTNFCEIRKFKCHSQKQLLEDFLILPFFGSSKSLKFWISDWSSSELISERSSLPSCFFCKDILWQTSNACPTVRTTFIACDWKKGNKS